MAILEVNDINVYYGSIHAIKGVSFEVNEGEIISLIGANGAGKTTVFNMLTGVYVPTSGTVELCGKDVTNLSPHKRVDLGIARTFQNIRLFKRMSVLENVKVCSNIHMNYSMFDGIFKTKKYFEQEDKATEEALEILKVLGLEEYINEEAQNLPYGKQRKLEIARALATSPQLLLLDEPAAGMNPTETAELMETIKIVREKLVK